MPHPVKNFERSSIPSNCPQIALDLPDGVSPVIEDILLAKMRAGHAIELEAHCTKGGALCFR